MTAGAVAQPIDILLVEDSSGDARLMRELLAESRVPNRLTVAKDGEEAMARLERRGSYRDAPRPHLILLDLNLPKKDGREVLAEIKAHPSLKSIPVVVLTTSQADQDVLKSYSLHANAYVTKPMGLDQFAAAVRAIEDFWLVVVKLPPGRGT